MTQIETKKQKQDRQRKKLLSDQRFRKYTLKSHQIENEIIKLIIQISNEEESANKSEMYLKDALNSIKKATRLLSNKE